MSNFWKACFSIRWTTFNLKHATNDWEHGNTCSVQTNTSQWNRIYFVYHLGWCPESYRPKAQIFNKCMNIRTWCVHKNIIYSYHPPCKAINYTITVIVNSCMHNDRLIWITLLYFKKMYGPTSLSTEHHALAIQDQADCCSGFVVGLHYSHLRGASWAWIPWDGILWMATCILTSSQLGVRLSLLFTVAI